MGIAYRASFVTLKHADSVWPNKTDAQQAINDVVRLGAKVVLMAWGTENADQGIEDLINLYSAAPYDVLFVGAAGTSHPWRRDVLFPAYLGNVLAVSATNDDGSRPSTAHYGGQVKLTAYINGPTTGMYTTALDRVGGTSAASAVVAGVATLVRARYPTWTRTQVRDRLINTAGQGRCGAPSDWRDAMVNAVAAVGGVCNSAVSGANSVYFSSPSDPPQTLTLTATQTSDSPLSFRWNYGSTNRTQQVTFSPGPPGDVREFVATVTVTDGATGQVFHRNHRIQVTTEGGGSCYPYDC